MEGKPADTKSNYRFSVRHCTDLDAASTANSSGDVYSTASRVDDGAVLFADALLFYKKSGVRIEEPRFRNQQSAKVTACSLWPRSPESCFLDTDFRLLLLARHGHQRSHGFRS